MRAAVENDKQSVSSCRATGDEYECPHRPEVVFSVALRECEGSDSSKCEWMIPPLCDEGTRGSKPGCGCAQHSDCTAGEFCAVYTVS